MCTNNSIESLLTLTCINMCVCMYLYVYIYMILHLQVYTNIYEYIGECRRCGGRDGATNPLVLRTAGMQAGTELGT